MLLPPLHPGCKCRRNAAKFVCRSLSGLIKLLNGQIIVTTTKSSSKNMLLSFHNSNTAMIVSNAAVEEQNHLKKKSESYFFLNIYVFPFPSQFATFSAIAWLSFPLPEVKGGCVAQLFFNFCAFGLGCQD